MRAQRLLAVAPDEDEADELARDLAFFLGAAGRSAARSRAGPPVLPYDDLSPDRGLEMERLAALSRLHLAPGSVKAVVVSARGLARRMIPRAVFEARTPTSSGKGVTIERDALRGAPRDARLRAHAARRGPRHLRRPRRHRRPVEPGRATPVRLELFGDAIESARAFDPETQRTLGDVDEVVLCPAREALFTDEAKEAAKQAVRDAAERVDRPTSRVREVLDAIDGGHALLRPGGAPPRLPRGRARHALRLPAGRSAVAWIDGADAVETALAELQAELAREHEATLRRDELALPPAAHFLARRAEALARAPGRGSRPARGLARHGGAAPLRLRRHRRPARRDPGRPRRRGRARAAHPAARGVAEARLRGGGRLRHRRSAADRLRRLLEDRRLAARCARRARSASRARLYDPGVHAHLFTGELSSGLRRRRGAASRSLSDEEIFGGGCASGAPGDEAENAFAAAFRELNEGDLVVHVDYGIAPLPRASPRCRSAGWRATSSSSPTTAPDRLYLPVANAARSRSSPARRPGDGAARQARRHELREDARSG